MIVGGVSEIVELGWSRFLRCGGTGLHLGVWLILVGKGLTITGMDEI